MARVKIAGKNHAGGEAVKLNPELDLYSRAVTGTLTDKYYEDSGKQIKEIRSAVRKVSPEFIGKLAVYAREEMYMRTLPLVLAVELAKIHNGDSLVSKTVERIVQRPDEIVKLLGYYEQANDRDTTKDNKTGRPPKSLHKLSHQIVKGIKKAFGKFDEYQLAKNNKDGAIKLRDAAFLAHPKFDKADKDSLITKLIDNRLAVPYTWETELSKLGQTKFANEDDKKQAFKEKWEELIDSKDENGHPLLGYMALMRNLRNILDSKVSADHIDRVAERLADKDEVVRSKQFPFRFFSASREIEDNDNKAGAKKLVKALDKALLCSADNIKGFDYDTGVVIATDISGSMSSRISEKSKVQNRDIGIVLGTLLNVKCENSVIGMFGDIWKPVTGIPQDSVLEAMKYMSKLEGDVGWSTNGHLVIQDLLNRKVVADKVMLFTDMQLWDSSGGSNSISKLWKEYREKINPNARIYLFNLAGYGTTPIDIKPEHGAYLIAGWSDKVFDVLEALENGAGAVEHIEKIVI